MMTTVPSSAGLSWPQPVATTLVRVVLRLGYPSVEGGLACR